MGRSLNAEGILGVFYASDYGARADGQIDDWSAINAAINAAKAAGGGQVWLPSNSTAVMIGSTILQPDNVELVIPTGCTLKLLPGKNCDLIANADPVNGNTGCKVTGSGTIDGNRTNNTSGTWHGINFTKVTDAVIDGPVIKSCRTNGINLSGCTRPVLNAIATDNGTHGIALVDTVRGTFDVRAYDNCRVAAVGTGDGGNLAGTSTDNSFVSIIAYDSAPAGKLQGYGIREAAASGCDRNVIAGASLGGNLTGTYSLVGASSKMIDASAVIAIAGSPTTQAFGDAAALGSSVYAAPLDHKHGMSSLAYDRNLSGTSVTNTTVETTIYQKTIVMNTLATFHSLRLTLLGRHGNTSGSPQNFSISVKLGSTILFTMTNSLADDGNLHRRVLLNFFLQEDLTSSAQFSDTRLEIGAPNSGNGTGQANAVTAGAQKYSNEDMTVNKDLVVTVQHGAASSLIQFTWGLTVLELL
ncbi:MAG: hypothetical protein M0T85_01735 [Dehalococcoidales bacterium]|nr:hypothetical protein [Dehalococcoidales bacterium]